MMGIGRVRRGQRGRQISVSGMTIGRLVSSPVTGLACESCFFVERAADDQQGTRGAAAVCFRA